VAGYTRVAGKDTCPRQLALLPCLFADAFCYLVGVVVGDPASLKENAIATFEYSLPEISA